MGLIHVQSAFAIDLGVATYVEVAEAKQQTIEDGSIVVSTLDGLYLSRYPYDPSVSGIISINSAIVLGAKDETNVPLLTKGNVSVRVSTINGPVLKGDPITSSNIPGVAMKATRAGMSIGTALEDYNATDPNAVGKVLVLVDVHYYNPSGEQDVDSSSATLDAWLRTSMATILALATTVVGFIFFGKFAVKGVESLGRNPLASNTIKVGIILQGLLFIALIAVGYFVSYLLVR